MKTDQDFPGPYASATGILFAEDFDEPTPTDAAGSPPQCDTAPVAAIVTLPAEEYEQALQNAHLAGQRAAEASAQLRHTAGVTQSLSQIADRLTQTMEDAAAQQQATAESVTRLIFGTLSAVLPTVCARHEASEIAGLVGDVLRTMSGEPTVCVFVPTDMVEPVRASLAALPQALGRRVATAGQDDIAIGDARIAWEHGSASRSSRLAQDAVRAVLAELGLLPTPQPPPGGAPPDRFSMKPPPPIPAAVNAPQNMEHANG